jgi:hypothetical protein
MYLVAIGWLYVALMMAVVEATAPNGSVMGALFTFLIYGLGPVALVLYVLGTPARKAKLRAQAAAELAQLRQQADEGGEPAAAGAVAAERKES